MKYVLDTNIVAALLNANPVVIARFARVPESDVALPIVVIAELLYGAHRSARASANVARVHALAARLDVLAVDAVVFERYAVVRAALADQGRPKSDFDLLIACTALVHDACLVTHDDALKDGAIAGLVLEDWLEVAAP